MPPISARNAIRDCEQREASHRLSRLLRRLAPRNDATHSGFPHPPPVGVTISIASPASSTVCAQPGNSSRRPSLRRTTLSPELAGLAAVHAEARHAAAAGQQRQLHRARGTGCGAACRRRRSSGPCRRSRGGCGSPRARRESGIPALPGRSGASWSCGCGRRSRRRSRGRPARRSRSSRNTDSARRRR